MQAHEQIEARFSAVRLLVADAEYHDEECAVHIRDRAKQFEQQGMPDWLALPTAYTMTIAGRFQKGVV